MTIAPWLTEVDYPDSDGKPMAEGDAQCNYLIYARSSLRLHFEPVPDVYVAGNLFIYYEEGNPQAVVAPDVFVVFGVEKRDQRSYKVWQEQGKYPSFVLEITSKSTVAEDQGTKKGLYAFLGVQEYFQYDPTGDYLEPQLKGFSLTGDVYHPIAPQTQANENLTISSQVLGLELRLNQGELHFYNPATGENLLSHAESETARQAAESRVDRLTAKLRELGIDPTEL